jgi:hypothetical protein
MDTKTYTNMKTIKIKKNNIYEYGECNGCFARRHTNDKNVQFILWKKADQKYVDGIGHTEDKCVNFDSSWWNNFIKEK